MSYLSDAHARLAYAIDKLTSPDMPTQPSADEQRQRRADMEEFAHIADQYLFAMANDAGVLNVANYMTVCQDALHDQTDISVLSEEAERIEEEDAEMKADPRGHARAEMEGVS